MRQIPALNRLLAWSRSVARLCCGLVGVTTSACMVSPTNGTQVCGTDAAVTLRGYTLSPGQSVQVQYSTNGSSYSPLATATSSISTSTVAGTSVYEWVTTAPVPAWQALRRGGYRAYLRGAQGGNSLVTFNATLPGGGTPEQCMNTQVASGSTPADALSACMSSASPVVTITAPAVSTCVCPASHVGDVAIATQADADMWACLQSLEGNLLVLGGAPNTVGLPQLQSIVGDVSLDFTTDGNAPRAIELPALQTITGDLSVTGAVTTGPVALGMNELDWVAGDINIELNNTGGTRLPVTGLNGLFVIPIEYAMTLNSSGAFDSTGFLNSFHSTETLTIESFGLDPAVGLPLTAPQLELAISLQVIYPPGLDPYPSLSWKGTILLPQLEFASFAHIKNDPFYDATPPATTSVGNTYPMLADVGLLWLEGSQLSDLNVGAASLSVDALRLDGNPALTVLNRPGLTINPSGSVEVVDNVALRQCVVDQFFATLTGSGYAGALISAGNNATTCGVCSPIAHSGDLTISTPQQATDARCISSVSGDLAITESPRTLKVELPALQSVAGDATLSYLLVSAPALGDRRTIDAPALQSIGGNLTVDAAYTEAAPAGIELGLNAVTNIGGDVAVTTGYGPLRGLAALTHLSGSLSLTGTNLDNGGSLFVPNLTTVGGDLQMQNFYAFISFFNNVTSVGGDLRVLQLRLMGGLSSLVSVGGDYVLDPKFYFPPPLLATVGGAVTLDGTIVTALDISGVPVVAGGLVLHANTNLTTLDPELSVAGAGPITITNNTALDTCAAQAYVAAQTGNGWSGTATISGNGSSACP